MPHNGLIVAVDFDGTIVEESFPEIGQLKPKVLDVVNTLHELGVRWIIWTCRGNVPDPNNGRVYVNEMKEFLDKLKFPYEKINENVDGMDFVTSRKIYYDYLIDDKLLNGEINWNNIYSELYYKLQQKDLIPSVFE